MLSLTDVVSEELGEGAMGMTGQNTRIPKYHGQINEDLWVEIPGPKYISTALLSLTVLGSLLSIMFFQSLRSGS